MTRWPRLMLVGCAIGAASAALAWAAGRTAFVRTVELKTYDYRVRLTADPASARRDIVLVGIDDSSIRRLEPQVGRWPWPRLVHASLIDFLARAPARVIVYDVLFTERQQGTFRVGDTEWSGAESDRALAASAARAGNVVFVAMLAAMNMWLATRMPPARRALIGLGLLLVSQFLLILCAGLAQGYPGMAAAMPSVDRAVTALSLVLLIWLWVFPDPMRQADFGTALLSVLVLTLAIFSSIRWINQSLYTSFNGSPADLLWTGFSMVLASAGFLFLIFRRSPGYGTGLAMFVLLFIGELAHFLSPSTVAGCRPTRFAAAFAR